MRKLVVFLSLIVFCFALSNSQDIIKPSKKKVSVEFGINYLSGSAYYDSTGNESSKFTEKVANPIKPSNPFAYYGTEYKIYNFNIAANYRLLHNLVLRAELPLGLFSSKESYKFDDKIAPTDTQNFTVKDRGSFSLFQPLYYSIGGRYQILDSGLFRASISSEFKAPTKFKNGMQTDDNSSIKRYGSFEMLFGGDITLKMATSWLNAGAAYNFRDKILKDQAIFHFEGGVSTVPQTYLKAWTDIVLSTSKIDKSENFDSRRFGYQENSYTLGFAFYLQVERDLFIMASYSLKFGGQYTWRLGNIGLTTGFNL